MKKLSLIIASATFLIFSSVGQAVECPESDPDCVDSINLGGAQTQGIAAGESLNNIISNGFTIAVTVAAVLVLAMLIWGAIEWVLSGGDKEKVANARKRIVNALIGLAILALAFLILNVVGGIVGFDILGDLTIPALGEVAGTPSPAE